MSISTEQYLQEIQNVNGLGDLAQIVTGCTRCRLREGCAGVVFGEGNPHARIMIIGEGPGAEEDRLGRPFVGKAGQLLDRMLGACGFDRFTHVYIANVVKCRPPRNRVPEPDERAACLPNLMAQIRLIQPQIIILLGATALQTLVNPAARITRERGRWIEQDGIFIMPTYHPAALLRNPNLKKETWEDLKQVTAKYRDLVDPHHITPFDATA